ncbi:MAG: DNA-directed RNA polymerase subunit alpha C-terminal domain-containing protein [Bryobacteraceae bacterium]
MRENSGVECSRFVIWEGASLDQCSPEDHGWLTELLKSRDFHSLQDLSGLDPSAISECADRFAAILNDSDLGRLVHTFWPGTIAQQPPNLTTQSVDILELSVRSAHCLQHAGIATIGDLTRWSIERLLTIKNMGRKSAMEIRAKLEELLLQNPDESQLPTSVRPEWLCLSALFSLEQCGLDEGICQRLNDAGISRIDDLVSRSIESLRYWAGLTDANVGDLQRQLLHVDLPLESLLPLWVRAHYSELQEAFEEDVEQLLSRDTTVDALGHPIAAAAQPLSFDTTIDSAVPVALSVSPTPACLEDELEKFFAANSNDRQKQIVRRLMGWDGGQGTTLEQAGQEFECTRERIRQILVKSLRPSTAIKPIFLEKAIGCVERCVPAYAEDAETALVDAGIIRTSFRVEGIEKTAKHLNVPAPWTTEIWNSRRLVVNPSAMRGIRDFFTAARKRVSHYGITRKDYVLAEISTEVTVETLDLYCSLLEGLVWLDELRQWFWLPTGKNSVLNRLTKILRVVPTLALSEARAGVLRDRRMEDVELPPDVFRRLCASLPWCRVEGDQLAAGGALPPDDRDSDETTLVEILRQMGPFTGRRDLWKLANGSGVEKVSFDRLLSESVVIIRPAREVYALIGSDLATIHDQILEVPQEDTPEVFEQPENDLPAEGAQGADVLGLCDPESADFHEQALGCILGRSGDLRAAGPWSLMEVGLTEADFGKLRQWGRISTIEFRDLAKRRLRFGLIPVTGIEAIAFTFLAYCCEIGRNAATEGEFWPIINNEIGPSLRRQIFANGYPKPRVRDATESICSRLNIRHVFGREGERSWLRSVFLQFGISRSGWKRLPGWLARGVTPLPVAIEVLLQPTSSLQSTSFAEFWQTLQRFRWQQLSLEQTRKALSNSSWVTESEIDRLLSAAAARPEVNRSEDHHNSAAVEESDCLMESPLLTWRDEPRFELPINSRCKWLIEPRYVLVLGSGKRIPLTRDQDEYTLNLPGGKLEVDLTEAVITVDLQRHQTSCLAEPLAITLAPKDYDFAFYGPNGRMLPYGEERFDSNGRFVLLCRSSCEVTIEPAEPYMRRVFRGDWTVRAYLQGVPNGLEIHKASHTLWTTPQQSPRTAVAARKMTVACAGGRWGESAALFLESFDEGVPAHLIVGRSRVPLERTLTGKFRGALVLSPNVDYGRVPVRIECVSNGRLRRSAATLQMGPLHGIAVETEAGWKVFKERVDMDAEYLCSHRILTQIPSHFDGDVCEIGDWAWMEGDHFCGRRQSAACAIGRDLHALGESLRLSVGPYNRPFGGQRLARGVIHSGVMHWIERDGDEYQIQLRRTFQFGPDHAIWVWHENQSEPEVVVGSDWIQEDDSCLIALHPGARPVAFAISFQGAWLGARTCQKGWAGFADLISSSTDWRATARWLRWWRIPLLHENLKTAAHTRIVESRLATMGSWASNEDLQGGAKYSEEHEDAWRSVTRSLLWDWKPDAKESAAILKGLGLLTGNPELDSEQAWEGYEDLLAIHPLLLAQAALRSLTELYPGQNLEDLLYLLEKLRNRILGIDLYASGNQIDKELTRARNAGHSGNGGRRSLRYTKPFARCRGSRTRRAGQGSQSPRCDRQ